MSRTRFAAIQMTSGAEVGANLDPARRFLESAAREGAALVVLPENFARPECRSMWKRSLSTARLTGKKQAQKESETAKAEASAAKNSSDGKIAAEKSASRRKSEAPESSESAATA